MAVARPSSARRPSTALLAQDKPLDQTARETLVMDRAALARRAKDEWRGEKATLVLAKAHDRTQGSPGVSSRSMVAWPRP